MKESELGVVVLSGGLDSTTALAMAIEEHGKENIWTVSFNYGQKHYVELMAARNIAQWYAVNFKLIKLPTDLFAGGVLTTDEEIKDMRYDDLPDGEMSPTYVPFRNGNLISQSVAFTDSLLRSELFPPKHTGDDNPIPRWTSARIWAGMHAEDAAGFAYADCTPEFLGAIANAVYVGTYRRVRLWTPFMHRKKAEIITIGNVLGVPYGMTHSCYRGQYPACGRCSTCHARLDAFKELNLNDPLPYAEVPA